MVKPPQSGRPGTMDREPTLYWGSSKVRTGLIRLDSFGRQQRPVGLHLLGRVGSQPERCRRYCAAMSSSDTGMTRTSPIVVMKLVSPLHLGTTCACTCSGSPAPAESP